MLSQDYLHPNGQMPAYEWNYRRREPAGCTPSRPSSCRTWSQTSARWTCPFSGRAFARPAAELHLVGESQGSLGPQCVRRAGFLGLDNIGVFDRSAALPTGGRLEQADGTAWMAMFSQNMLEMSLAPPRARPELRAIHAQVRRALLLDRRQPWTRSVSTPDEMWDEEDGFFYDVLRLPDGTGTRIKVRSLVGLLPLCATTVIEEDLLHRFPEIAGKVRAFLERNQDLLANIADPLVPGAHGRRLLSLVNEDKLRRILARMLDEERFLGPHGIRSISRWHLEHPYSFNAGGAEHQVQYEPAESTSGMFGGNSNWRGPVWFPINLLLIRALLQHYRYYGNDLKVECPTGSGTMMTLFEVAQELSRRLAATFLRDDEGRRPVYGGTKVFQEDPHWRDLILFYEYFHGDNGAGLGASHQTGWTGLVARLIQSSGQFDAESVLDDPHLADGPALPPSRRRPVGDVTTAREARGVREPESSP